MTPSLKDRVGHRAEWLRGARDLTLGLASRPVVDPVMVALRRVLAPSPSTIDGVSMPALADAARRHEVEVFAALRVPELATILKTEISDRRRAVAILELAQAEVSADLASFQVAWLKGSVTASLYPQTACRSRRDLDLLVGDQIHDVRLHLLSRGWKDAVTPSRAEAGPLAVRAWPMTRAYGPFGVSLDLHRHLLARPWCSLEPGPVLAASKAGLPIPEDTFLITLNHLIESGLHEPMKGWLDLAWLAPTVTPNTLTQRAQGFAMERAVWLADLVLTRWFPGHRPLSRTAPNRLTRQVLGHLAAGDHDTPERQPLYKGLSQRLWRALLTER